MNNHRTPTTQKRKDRGTPVIIGLFVLSSVLGVIVFRNYISTEKAVTLALSQVKSDAPRLSIEDCAARNMHWYLNCTAMKQICDDTVSRMMKVCLVNGDKTSQCALYGNDIYGYNFGAAQCKPYLKNHDNKKACADTYQAIADYCKAVTKK